MKMLKNEYKSISKRAQLLLNLEEGLEIDFKRDLKGLKSEDLVAFANSNKGGTILIGVDENTDKKGRMHPKIIGCPVNDTEKLRIIHMAQSCNPNITLEVIYENVSVNSFIRIEIPSGENKPYCTSGGTYKIRMDGNNSLLKPDLLLTMFLEKESIVFLNRFRNATESIDKELKNVSNVFQKELDELKINVTNDIKAMRTGVIQMIDEVKDGFDEGLTEVKDNIETVVFDMKEEISSDVSNTTDQILSDLDQGLQNIYSNIRQDLSLINEDIQNNARTTTKNINSYLTAIVNEMKSNFEEISSLFSERIQNSIEQTEINNEKIEDIFNELVEINGFLEDIINKLDEK